MEPREETQELLRRLPLFADLSEHQLSDIASVAAERKINAGVRIFHEGDPGDTCFVIRDGRVRVTRQHTDGRAITLATFGPGDFFGELAMLDGELRSATVEATEPLELVAIPGVELRSLLSSRPEVATKLIGSLARRLREANNRIANQSFQTVPSRVAGALLRLGADETGEGRPGAVIRMKQADLAQIAGTSRESVSRFLATLERAGIVSVGRGRVVLIEPTRLNAFVY